MFRNVLTNRINFFLILLSCNFFVAVSQLSVVGGKATAPIKAPGQKLYLYVVQPSVSRGTIGFSLPITEPSQKLYSYQAGIEDAAPVLEATYDSGLVTVSEAQFDRVYFLSPAQGTAEYHRLFYYPDYSLDGVSVQAEISVKDVCRWLDLSFSPTIKPFIYITPQGKEEQLSRKLTVTYKDLVYKEAEELFEIIDRNYTIDDLQETNTLEASLTDTDYRVLGDRFSQELGLSVTSVPSPVVQTNRLEAHSVYTVQSSGQKKDLGEEASLSNELSAPASVRMRIVANVPSASLFSWRIVKAATNAPDAPLVLQYNGMETEYTFTEAGTYTIVPTVSNRQATCAQEAEKRSFSISTSQLLVPNAFSPFGSPGVNDVFRVVHRSIVRFMASVFDEWGNLIYSWQNPEEGWDGLIKGKKANPGVYYYVISAFGADGKEYNLNGSVHLMQGDASTDQFN